MIAAGHPAPISPVPTPSVPVLEIAIGSAAGAVSAQLGGADRLELCNALELGGVTPSAGLTESVLAATNLPVHALVRPRPGDFCYSASELSTAEQEARLLARQGVAGIVLGALTSNGRIDPLATTRIIAAARSAAPSVEITFHKAFDQTADPLQALELLAELGVDRVLSSGQAQRALDGVSVLATMRAQHSGVQIMAGGRLLPADIAELARNASVDAVHFSAKRPGPSAPNGAISLGSADGVDPNAYFVTDQALVRQARAEIAALADSVQRLPASGP